MSKNKLSAAEKKAIIAQLKNDGQDKIAAKIFKPAGRNGRGKPKRKNRPLSKQELEMIGIIIAAICIVMLIFFYS